VYELLRYLIMNRQGTRLGRATWLYFAVVAAIIAASEAVAQSVVMWLIFFSPLLLLLNRFDRSGPTMNRALAAEEAAKAHEAAVWHRVAYKLGKWVGRMRRH